MGHLIGLPSWAVGLVAMILLGAFWVLEYAVRLRRQLNPSIDLSFDPSGPGLVRTPAKKPSDGGSPYEEFEENYIRIGVETSAKRAILDCEPHLVAIHKKSGGNFVPTAFSDPMELPWSLRGVRSIQIARDVKRFIDVLKTNSETNTLEFVSPWPLTLRNFFDDKTTYRLKIVVVGDGVSRNITLDVNWTGEWDRISVSEVTDG